MSRRDDLSVDVVQVTLFNFQLTRTGLRPASTKKPPSFGDWQKLGDYLRWMEGSISWLIGDWLTYGEATFSEKASQAVDATGWQLDTIKQIEWVCRKVPPAIRDPDLKFSHHRAVADLPVVAQQVFLKKAKREQLTVAQLQRAVQRVKKPAESDDQTLWLMVSCRSSRDRERLIERMEQEGRSVKVS